MKILSRYSSFRVKLVVYKVVWIKPSTTPFICFQSRVLIGWYSGEDKGLRALVLVNYFKDHSVGTYAGDSALESEVHLSSTPLHRGNRLLGLGKHQIGLQF